MAGARGEGVNFRLPYSVNQERLYEKEEWGVGRHGEMKPSDGNIKSLAKKNEEGV